MATDDTKLNRQTSMSNSTKAHSDQEMMNIPDITNPHANLALTEMELAEIYSRPYMNADHAKYGCDPQSNRILDTEKALIDAKAEKC